MRTTDLRMRFGWNSGASLAAAISASPVDANSPLLESLTLPATTSEWETFFRAAELWQVAPLTMSNLQRISEWMAVPEQFLQRAELLKKETRIEALTRSLIVCELAEQMQAGGVPVIVLKGPTIAERVFHDPSLRSFSDADFLIRPENLTQGREILLTLGFSRDYVASNEPELIAAQHALEFSSPRFKVELHSSLLSRHLALHFDTDELWNTAVPMSIGTKTLQTLSPSTHFLFLCAHGAKHEFARLKWLVDIHQFAGSLSATDADETIAKSERVHARRLLALGLRLAETFFGSTFGFPRAAFMDSWNTDSMSEAVAMRLAPDSDARRRIGRLEKKLPGVAALRFWNSARERWRDRFESYRTLLFPHSSSADKMPAQLARSTSVILRGLRKLAS